MRKQFISSLSLLLFVNFLVKPLWIFGIDLQVQNEVGTAAYGWYAAVFSFTIMFNILLDLGLSHYSNRNMAQNPQRLAQSFSRLTTVKFVLGLVYLLVALGIGHVLGYTQKVFTLLLLLAFNQFLLSLIVFFRSHLAGLQFFRADAVMSVLDKILTILFCGTVLYTTAWGLKMTIVLFALLQTISLGLAAATGFAMLYRKTPVFKFSFRYQKVRKQIKQSLPYAALILLMGLYTRVDSVMLQQISGELEAGVYAQAFRLIDAINQPAYLFSVLLLPMFAGMLARQESVEELSKLAFSLVMVLTIGVAVASAYNAPDLMAALYNNETQLSTPVFQWLVFSAVAFGATYIFGTLLTARGNLALLNKVALGGFLVNVVLNLVLIPVYGAFGAAVATVITQGLTAVLQIIFSFKIMRYQFGLSFWLSLGFFALLVLMSTHFLIIPLSVHWAASFGVVLLVTLGWALLLKLLPLKAAIDLIKKRLATH
jgi:O-antigen/teichoic acid export membrane protein